MIIDYTITEVMQKFPRIGNAIEKTIQFQHDGHKKWTAAQTSPNDFCLYLHTDSVVFDFSGIVKLHRFIKTVGVDYKRNLYLVLKIK